MADSNITKQAMATAFKELLQERSFEKISVSDICDRCRMNRKSFYYHFRDKFDLANWIFDTEIVELAQQHDIDMVEEGFDFESRMEDLAVICDYFYANHPFYHKILQVEGQNSFQEHFKAFLHPIMEKRLHIILGEQDIPQMVYDFVVDGIACAFERWLREKNCATGGEFLSNLKLVMKIMILGLSRRVQENSQWLQQMLTEEK